MITHPQWNELIDCVYLIESCKPTVYYAHITEFTSIDVTCCAHHSEICAHKVNNIQKMCACCSKPYQLNASLLCDCCKDCILPSNMRMPT